MTKARDIADGVDTADIADGAISTAKLADGSISTAKIADTAITDAKIAGMSSSKLTGALPAVDGSALTGISAGLPGPRAEVFTSSGTFTVPSGVTAVKVTVVGGGGGGRGVVANTYKGANGGSAGGVAIKWITGLTSGNTETVTIGAGGAGGAASSTATSYGSAGGTSSFGSHCSATGGSGGTGLDSSTYTNSGVGSGGDINIQGGKGGNSGGGTSSGGGNSGGGGVPIATHPHDPGGYFPAKLYAATTMSYSDAAYYNNYQDFYSFFGGKAGRRIYPWGSGEDATGYGCGGSGGAGGPGLAATGGDGFAGLVIVEY